MQLKRITSEGTVGVYTPENSDEKRAADHLLGVNITKLESRRRMQDKLARTLETLFPGSAMQVRNNHDRDSSAKGKPIVTKGAYEVEGVRREYVSTCVELPSVLDRSERYKGGYFDGKFHAGTLTVIEGGDGEEILATLDITRSYDVVGQHQFGVATHLYREGVVDELVNKLGEKWGNPSIQSPRLATRPKAAFVPGFASWDQLLEAYQRAQALVTGDQWSSAEWNTLREDARTAPNPVLKKLFIDEYTRRIMELVDSGSAN